MPRIPLGSEAGLGNAEYKKVGTTPALGRPVQQELGPALQTQHLDVVQKQAAPLSQIRPVLPSLSDPIGEGIDRLARRAEQFAAEKQAEVARVNEAAERTKLLVQVGDQKTNFRKDALDIINNTELPDEEKAVQLQKREDDFRATIQSVKPEYQPVVASEVMNTIGTVRNEAQNVFIKNKQNGIRADLETRSQQLILDAASTGDLKGTMDHFDAMSGAYKSAGLPEAHFVADRHKFEQTILQNDIMGNLKTVDSKGGVESLAIVTNLYDRLTAQNEDGTPMNWTRLDPAQRNADVAAVLQKKHQIEADLQTGANSAISQVKSSFSMGMSFYTDALRNGDPVDPKFVVQLHKQAQDMVRMDPDKTTGYMALEQLRKTERDMGPGYQAEQNAKDPLRGTGVQPISFQDTASPEALQAKISQNIAVGQAVQQAKGLTFVPVLRNQDMEGIARTIETNPGNGLVLVQTLKNALGNEGTASMTYLAGQMANSKDPAAPAVAAIIYNVAKGDMATAQVVANGLEVQKTKAITMPKDTELRGLFDKQLGDAMADNSANRGVNYEAYKVAYASLAARKNLTDGSFDKETANEAFKRVVGTTAKWNGSSVLLPEDMDENRFRDYLKSITPETIAAWGGIHGMKNDRAVDFIQDDATLRVVSPGRYSVIYEGKQALTTAGRPFIIDLSQPIINSNAPLPPSMKGLIDARS